MTLSERGAGSSHRDPALKSVGTDLNNSTLHLLPGGLSCTFTNGRGEVTLPF